MTISPVGKWLASFSLAVLGACSSGGGGGYYSLHTDGGTSTGGSDLATDVVTGPSDMAQVQGSCTYPTGPYGVSIGDTVSPTLKWSVYLPGQASVSTLRSTDLFDCDGSHGINAVELSEGAMWCSACQTEASEVDQELSSRWEAMGIKVVLLMIEDDQSNPATVSTAMSWKQAYQIQRATVGADPDFTFADNGNNSLPLGVLVDPRTMKIVDKIGGYQSYDPEVEQVAQQNGG